MKEDTDVKMKKECFPKRKRVAILHPDLGIGGAEQLIINVALALQNKGFFVKILTPHCDKKHCFQEVKDKLVNVEIHGNLFPRTICGKFWAFCAYIRMFLCALYLLFLGGKYDCVILDQVPFPILILRPFMRTKVLFYCHFPDKLLCTQRRNCLKRIYRFFIDFIEELTMGMAHKILVNSEFTKQTFKNSFKILSDPKRCRLCYKKKIPEILYPSIKLSEFDSPSPEVHEIKNLEFLKEKRDIKIICSLNRYERKKNIGLAIETFSLLLKTVDSEYTDNLLLVIAGGFDPTLHENVDHFSELQTLTRNLNIPQHQIVFLKSISNQERSSLLKKAQVLFYTPQNEHFGIVPVEAMYNKCIVFASNTGGPRESVIHEQTGFLLDSDSQLWVQKLQEVILNPQLTSQMAQNARIHAAQMFSDQTFADSLEKIVWNLILNKNKGK